MGHEAALNVLGSWQELVSNYTGAKLLTQSELVRCPPSGGGGGRCGTAARHGWTAQAFVATPTVSRRPAVGAGNARGRRARCLVSGWGTGCRTGVVEELSVIRGWSACNWRTTRACGAVRHGALPPLPPRRTAVCRFTAPACHRARTSPLTLTVRQKQQPTPLALSQRHRSPAVLEHTAAAPAAPPWRRRCRVTWRRQRAYKACREVRVSLKIL